MTECGAKAAYLGQEVKSGCHHQELSKNCVPLSPHSNTSSPLQERLSFFNSFIQIVLKRETETAAVKYICKYFQFLWLKNRQEGCSSVKLFSFVCYIKDRLEDMDVLLVFCHFIIKKFPWLHFLVSNQKQGSANQDATPI